MWLCSPLPLFLLGSLSLFLEMDWANLDVFLLINIDAYLAKTNMDLTHLFLRMSLILCTFSAGFIILKESVGFILFKIETV